VKNRSVLASIKQLRRPVFTTHEVSALSGKSLSSTTQALAFLEREGILHRIYRGIWADTGDERMNPYSVIPFLFPRHRAYVSFISALHLHGIIEQIPHTITLASMGHSKIIHTDIGTFSIHRIHPKFFDGFGWYRGTGNFLVAEPEKALIDSLYLSSRKKRQYGHFPELHFQKSFSLKKANEWVKKIPDYRIRICVQGKLNSLLSERRSRLR